MPKIEKTLFLVGANKNSVLAGRAETFSGGLDQNQITVVYSSKFRMLSLYKFLSAILKTKPRMIIIFDSTFAGVCATFLGKLFFNYKVLLDTGDATGELARTTGMHTAIGAWLVAFIEKLAYKISDKIIVRGSFHKSHLQNLGYTNVEVIHDGFRGPDHQHLDTTLRKQLHLEGYLTFGLIGSSHFYSKLPIPYGWDVVEALNLLKDYPIKGVLIGGGTGVEYLKKKASALGIQDKMLFIPPIPQHKIPDYLNCIDICISTQTDNLVGWVRTTGKLVDYMANGKFILATHVGEASKVLPQEMLLPYHGLVDDEHPKRLAKRILEIYQQPNILALGEKNREIAANFFAYPALKDRFQSVLKSLRDR